MAVLAPESSLYHHAFGLLQIARKYYVMVCSVFIVRSQACLFWSCSMCSMHERGKHIDGTKYRRIWVHTWGDIRVLSRVFQKKRDNVFVVCRYAWRWFWAITGYNSVRCLTLTLARNTTARTQSTHYCLPHRLHILDCLDSSAATWVDHQT